jgi:hypothetical protein
MKTITEYTSLRVKAVCESVVTSCVLKCAINPILNLNLVAVNHIYDNENKKNFVSRG